MSTKFKPNKGPQPGPGAASKNDGKTDRQRAEEFLVRWTTEKWGVISPDPEDMESALVDILRSMTGGKINVRTAIAKAEGRS